MAISVLDVRDTFATPHVRVPALRLVAGGASDTPSATTAPRRLPLSALAGGLLAIVESIALLAVALTGLDGVLSSSVRPTTEIVVLSVVVLAGWIVLCAGGGAALIDGAGRKLVVGVAYGEMVLVSALLVIATALPVFAPPAGLPLPLLALVLLAVPVAKLLLAGAPAAGRWVAGGPRARVCLPDPVATHRVLATATLGVIGAALVAVAVLAPAQGPGDGSESAASTVVYQND
jgi:hypothetical protein